MSADRRALAVLAVPALAAGIALLVVTGGDGLVVGERGPRLGAFVHGNPAAGWLFTIAGALLIAAAVTGRRLLPLIAAALLLGGALVHVGGLAAGGDVLGGSGSTLAALLGLGSAALAVGATGDPR